MFGSGGFSDHPPSSANEHLKEQSPSFADIHNSLLGNHGNSASSSSAFISPGIKPNGAQTFAAPGTCTTNMRTSNFNAFSPNVAETIPPPPNKPRPGEPDAIGKGSPDPVRKQRDLEDFERLWFDKRCSQMKNPAAIAKFTALVEQEKMNYSRNGPRMGKNGPQCKFCMSDTGFKKLMCGGCLKRGPESWNEFMQRAIMIAESAPPPPPPFTTQSRQASAASGQANGSASTAPGARTQPPASSSTQPPQQPPHESALDFWEHVSCWIFRPQQQ